MSQDFRDLQFAFTAHLRNPADNPAPGGVEDRRMAIYRDLFYNNINGFLCNAFPVLNELLDEKRWHELVRAFFAGHLCYSPYFVDIPTEFVSWLETDYQSEKGDPGFIIELASYELLDMVLAVSPQALPDAVDPTVEPAQLTLQCSPLARIGVYQWPVHRIGRHYQPDAPLDEPVCLLVYRDRDDDMHFMEINPPTAMLLELIQQQPGIAIKPLLDSLATQLGYPDPQPLYEFAQSLIMDFVQRDVLLVS